MTKQLTTQNATITTVAVEVKALKISGKQVTQSVYRQLREEPLIAHNGVLNGVPWGYVNHCPERKYWSDTAGEWRLCDVGTDHRHVIWQYDAELRRSRIACPPTWWRPYWSDDTDAYLQAVYCANSHRYPSTVSSASGGGVEFNYNGTSCMAAYPTGHRGDGECTGAQLAVAAEELSEDIGREHDRRARHKALWQSIKELPQLFIAV